MSVLVFSVLVVPEMPSRHLPQPRLSTGAVAFLIVCVVSAATAMWLGSMLYLYAIMRSIELMSID
jgi:hypothetical protein